MKERIERSWGPGMFPSHEEISHAKWLVKTVCCENSLEISSIFYSFISEASGILDTRKIERLTKGVRDALNDYENMEFKQIIKLMRAASLAHHGLLSFVDRLTLDGSLSQVPAQHLASLVSCVHIIRAPLVRLN